MLTTTYDRVSVFVVVGLTLAGANAVIFNGPLAATTGEFKPPAFFWDPGYRTLRVLIALVGGGWATGGLVLFVLAARTSTWWASVTATASILVIEVVLLSLRRHRQRRVVPVRARTPKRRR